MVPPATALTQNTAICAAARHTEASSAQSAARARLTVAPQLPWAASSSVCRGLSSAFLQALDQKEVEDMMLLLLLLLLLLPLEGRFQRGAAQAAAQCRSDVKAGGEEEYTHPPIQNVTDL